MSTKTPDFDKDLKIIYPEDFDEFGETPPIILKARMDLPGPVYWRWKSLIKPENNQVAEEYLISQFLIISEKGKDRNVSPTELQSHSLLQDGRVWVTVLAHADRHFGRFFVASEIHPKEYDHGSDQSVLWKSDDPKNPFKILAEESITKGVIDQYRRRAVKNAINATKWLCCQIYSIDPGDGAGSPESLSPDHFPVISGGEVKDEGDPRLTFETWSLMDAYLLKNWLAPYRAT